MGQAEQTLGARRARDRSRSAATSRARSSNQAGVNRAAGAAGFRSGRSRSVRQRPSAQAQAVAAISQNVGSSPGVARAQVSCAALERVGVPATALSVVEDELVTALEGVVEARERSARRPSELLVGVAHQPERVVVEAEPDVQPVLLDPVGVCGVAAARALAAEAPAELVDRHLEALAQLRRGGQLEGGGHAADATAEHGHLVRPSDSPPLATGRSLTRREPYLGRGWTTVLAITIRHGMGAADDSSRGVGAREVEPVRGAYQRWNEGDLEALSGLMAEDVVYQNAPEWPGQRVYRGSDTVMRFLRDEVFETIALTPVEVVGTEVFGDEILLELRAHTHGTISGLDLDSPSAPSSSPECAADSFLHWTETRRRAPPGLGLARPAELALSRIALEPRPSSGHGLVPQLLGEPHQQRSPKLKARLPERASVESGRRDLNSRPFGPQPNALPSCATPR